MLAALTEYLGSRARSGPLSARPDVADTAVDALIHALVPHAYPEGRP